MVDLALLQSVSYIAGALGVSVAAVYYVLNLKSTRRTQELALKAQEQTLETRQTQMFMQLYDRFSTPDFNKVESIIIGQYKWNDFEDFMKKYSWEGNPESWALIGSFASYFEGIGVLVKRKLIDPSLVDDLMSNTILQYWEKYGPVFREARVRYNVPQLWEWVEYLYDVVKQIYVSQHPEVKT